MLYQIGPVTIEPFPFSADSVNRQTGADFASHDLLGRLRGREFVGEGDETLTISGTIFPAKAMFNGLPELDHLHGARKAGRPVYVMRGDGAALGWFVVEAISEAHEMLGRNGVGQKVGHEIKLTKVSDTGGRNMLDPGRAMINAILTLFRYARCR